MNFISINLQWMIPSQLLSYYQYNTVLCWLNIGLLQLSFIIKVIGVYKLTVWLCWWWYVIPSFSLRNYVTHENIILSKEVRLWQIYLTFYWENKKILKKNRCLAMITIYVLSATASCSYNFMFEIVSWFSSIGESQIMFHISYYSPIEMNAE